MKQTLLLTLIFSLILLSENTKSQTNTRIDPFLEKVDNILMKYDSTAVELKSRKSISGRKFYNKGTMDIRNKFFKKITKYYRSGLKKEKIKIYALTSSKKLLIMKIIRINDKYVYVKLYQTLRNKNYELIYATKEVLINGYYVKTFFDDQGREIKKEYFFEASR